MDRNRRCSIRLVARPRRFFAWFRVSRSRYRKPCSCRASASRLSGRATRRRAAVRVGRPGDRGRIGLGLAKRAPGGLQRPRGGSSRRTRPCARRRECARPAILHERGGISASRRIDLPHLYHHHQSISCAQAQLRVQDHCRSSKSSPANRPCPTQVLQPPPISRNPHPGPGPPIVQPAARLQDRPRAEASGPTTRLYP